MAVGVRVRVEVYVPSLVMPYSKPDNALTVRSPVRPVPATVKLVGVAEGEVLGCGVGKADGVEGEKLGRADGAAEGAAGGRAEAEGLVPAGGSSTDREQRPACSLQVQVAW